MTRGIEDSESRVNMTKPNGKQFEFSKPKDLDGVPDGKVSASFDASVGTDDFGSEKSLLNYILSDMTHFCEWVLCDKLVSFEVEKPIRQQQVFSARGRRIDLYIVGEKKKYIVELKNKKGGAENRYAIGQVLDYGREFPSCELVLLTTHYDFDAARTIQHYNLPIRYIYFDKKRIMTWDFESTREISQNNSES